MVESSLYIIDAEGLDFVKVGRSKNPENRLRQLRTGSPYKLRLLKVYEECGNLEPIILGLLRERVPTNGEWFLRGGIDLDALIEQARVIHDAHLRYDNDLSPMPTRESNTLGAKIKEARKANGMLQKDLRDKTGLSMKYLSEIENDRVDPRFSIVQRIAQALQMDIGILRDVITIPRKHLTGE